MKEVTIVRFSPEPKEDNDPESANTSYAEEKLTQLVNQGWNIVSSGGASYTNVGHQYFPAFVVLVRENPSRTR